MPPGTRTLAPGPCTGAGSLNAYPHLAAGTRRPRGRRADLLAAGVQEWVHLPLWLNRETARTAWDVDTTRAQELGLTTRSLKETVADTWAWMQTSERPPLPVNRPAPGLPPDLEARLLATH